MYDKKAERARRLFKEGYNCAQAVVGAFAGEMGMDFDTAIKLASSFGGGMGRMREVCGAVSGMFIVAGVLYGYSDPKDKEAKDKHYALIQELAEQFKNSNGSIICKNLLTGTNLEPNVLKIKVKSEKLTQHPFQRREPRNFIERDLVTSLFGARQISCISLL